MDNVTHTLAGLLLAETVIQVRRRLSGGEPSSRFRQIAVVSSAVAANLPDLDVLYTLGDPHRLTYLLHHRGHTHTVLITLLGGLVVWAIATMVWRWRAGTLPAASDTRWLGGVLLLSALSHLVLDWTNSYGVHPFWPFDNHWRYGDAVFIVEPWLWVVSIPVLVAASPHRVSRGLLSMLMLVILVLAWSVDLVPGGAAAVLSGGAIVSVLGARLLPTLPRVMGALLAWIVVTVVMAASAATARAVVLRDVQHQEPGTEIVDVVVSPLPANLVCVSVIVIDRAADVYRVTLGRVSTAAGLTPAHACAQREEPAALFRPSPWASGDAVQWDHAWVASASELATLARESCPVLAGLQFMRVPVWVITGDEVLLGDARYGGGSGRSFSDIRVPRHSAVCPSARPPWIPPRADFLRR